MFIEDNRNQEEISLKTPKLFLHQNEAPQNIEEYQKIIDRINNETDESKKFAILFADDTVKEQLLSKITNTANTIEVYTSQSSQEEGSQLPLFRTKYLNSVEWNKSIFEDEENGSVTAEDGAEAEAEAEYTLSPFSLLDKYTYVLIGVTEKAMSENADMKEMINIIASVSNILQIETHVSTTKNQLEKVYIDSLIFGGCEFV